MKTKTKVIAGAAAVLIVALIAIGALVVGYRFVDKKLKDPARRVTLDKAWDDGKSFGETTDQNGCMAKALSLTDAADAYGLSNNDFDHACLSASARSAGFCDGVVLGFGGRWPEAQCADRRVNKTACITAYERKQFFCRIESGM